jgi:hypothetical protein
MGCKRPQFTKSISKSINVGLMVNFRNKWRIKRRNIDNNSGRVHFDDIWHVPFFQFFITTKQCFYVDFLTNFRHIRHSTKRVLVKTLLFFYINLTKSILIYMIKND